MYSYYANNTQSLTILIRLSMIRPLFVIKRTELKDKNFMIRYKRDRELIELMGSIIYSVGLFFQMLILHALLWLMKGRDGSYFLQDLNVAYAAPVNKDAEFSVLIG